MSPNGQNPRTQPAADWAEDRGDGNPAASPHFTASRRRVKIGFKSQRQHMTHSTRVHVAGLRGYPQASSAADDRSLIQYLAQHQR
jgi:hypothetical protein